MIQSMWVGRIEDVQRLWKWFLALGIGLVLLGMIALGASVAVTLASVLFFGILFIISGIFQAVQAFFEPAASHLQATPSPRYEGLLGQTPRAGVV